MPNLRIVSDNAVDRAATLVASTTSGQLVAANLLSDRKSLVWRSTVPTATTLTATWADAETVACVALPHCNLSPASTIRVQLYDAAAGGTLLLDTNTLQPGALACPAPARIPRGFTASAAASAYAYGGGAYARIWFAATAGVKRMVVTLVDAANLQGYIEAARLVAGRYWSPSENASYGASLSAMDLSTHYRTEAGDMMTDAGTRARSIDVQLDHMSAADRAQLFSIFLGGGMPAPLFFSLFPQSPDLALERDHMIYGKLSDMGAVTLPYMAAYSTRIPIEEI